MKVHVTAYGVLREVFGARSFDLELDRGAATISDVTTALVARTPAFGSAVATTAVAIDDELVAHDAPVPDGAAIALLPPVSGG